MQDIYVVLYKDYTALDAFGPVEVLGSIDDFKLHFVSLDGGIVINQQFHPPGNGAYDDDQRRGHPADSRRLGSRTEVDHEAFIKALGQAIDKSELVLSVCTGAALVAKTGALDGKRATSNKRAFDWVVSCRPEVKWEKPSRWVHDGKFYTAAGVSAGIDMALGFIGDRFGEEQAVEICTRMEYNWNRNADEACP